MTPEHKEKIYLTALSSHLKGQIIDVRRGNSGIVYIIDLSKYTYPRYLAYKTFKEDLEEDRILHFIREARQFLLVSDHMLLNTAFYISYFQKKPLICMPYCHSSLEKHMLETDGSSVIETTYFVCQILKGLIVLNQKGIEHHQDIKPSNILIYKDNIHNLSEYILKISDFGLANLYKEFGHSIGGGTFPFKAPEQYNPEQYTFFHPDIFAVGVISCMLLTKKHPCGLNPKQVLKRNPNKPKPQKRWETWAKEGNRIVENENKPLKSFILKMLHPEPVQRPSADEAFDFFFSILKKTDENIANKLQDQLDYYDSMDEYKENNGAKLKKLEMIYSLPNQDKYVFEEIEEEIKLLNKNIDCPKKVVKLLTYYHLIGILLIKKDRQKNKNEIIGYAEKIISIIYDWYPKIETKHYYVPEPFEGESSSSLPTPDFELHSQLIRFALNLLSFVTDDHSIIKNRFIENNYLTACYLYTLAGLIKEKCASNLDEYIKIMDEAIDKHSNATLWFFRGIWRLDYYNHKRLEGSYEKKLDPDIKASIISDIEKAVELGPPDWKEPKNLLISLLTKKCTEEGN